MEATRLPYVKLIKMSQVASNAAVITQGKDEKKIILDKYSDTTGLSPTPSKEFVIIKRTLLSKKCLQKSYLQTRTNQPMMSISKYVLLFGVDQELTHFLINDCDGKIPVRFDKNEKHQSEVSVNNATKEELGELCFDEGSTPKRRKLATNMSQPNNRKCSSERNAKRKSSKKNCRSKRKRRSTRLKNSSEIKAPPSKGI